MRYIAQSVIAVNDRSVSLQWDKNTESDLAGYLVYMSIGDDLHFVQVTPDPLPDPIFVSPILRVDTIYYFQISAIDTSGNESPRSQIIKYQLPDSQ